MRQTVYVAIGLSTATAIVVAAWLALQQREPDSGNSGHVETLAPASDARITPEPTLGTPTDVGYRQASPVVGSRSESSPDPQSSRFERIGSNPGNLVPSEKSLAIGLGEANLNKLERGPGESQSTLATTVEQLDQSGPGEGFDDVGAPGLGPGEGPQHDDRHDAGPGANDADITGPGPREAGPGIDDPGPGEAGPGIDEPGPGEADPGIDEPGPGEADPGIDEPAPG